MSPEGGIPKKLRKELIPKREGFQCSLYAAALKNLMREKRLTLEEAAEIFRKELENPPESKDINLKLLEEAVQFLRSKPAKN